METKTTEQIGQEAIAKLQVSSSPHIRSTDTVQRRMLDVIIALVPAMVAAVVIFGMNALLVIAVAVVSSVVAEALTQKLLKTKVTIGDLSAVVTGILLAFNVPSSMPLWMVSFGAIFAIVIVKQIFGGIGKNFLNPALAARAVLLSSWPTEMSAYTVPFSTDALSGPTPLSGGQAPELMDMFLGKMPGVLGEVSAAALLLGAVYLIVRQVMHARIPVVMIATTAVFLLVFGIPADQIPAQLLSGGLILGACFMATDYVTAPITAKGQIIFAFGAGFLTALIRVHGGYPEGVSFAILLMNVCTPLIDKYVKTKTFGGAKK